MAGDKSCHNRGRFQIVACRVSVVIHQLSSDTDRCQVIACKCQVIAWQVLADQEKICQVIAKQPSTIKQSLSSAGGVDSIQCLVTRALDGTTGMTQLKRRV